MGRLAIFPIQGGSPRRLLELPEGTETQAATFRWMPDGRSIAFIATHKGVSNVWAMPVEGGAPRQLTHFTADHIFKFAISPRGDSVACSRGSINSDVVSISGAL
jgi:Tol biopolymer transport system component